MPSLGPGRLHGFAAKVRSYAGCVPEYSARATEVLIRGRVVARAYPRGPWFVAETAEFLRRRVRKREEDWAPALP